MAMETTFLNGGKHFVIPDCGRRRLSLEYTLELQANQLLVLSLREAEGLCGDQRRPHDPCSVRLVALLLCQPHMCAFLLRCQRRLPGKDGAGGGRRLPIANTSSGIGYPGRCLGCSALPKCDHALCIQLSLDRHLCANLGGTSEMHEPASHRSDELE